MSGWSARARRIATAGSPPSRRLAAEFVLQRRLGKLDDVLSQLDLDRRVQGRAIDVGANTGAYTYAFSRIFDRVEAFEPQPGCAARLADFARSHENVRVHRFGLSDRAGRAKLFVPVVAGRWRRHLATGIASLRSHPSLPSRVIEIDLMPLDAFGFDDVAAIKVDVEGHEYDVLAGARETIVRCKPTLIVEIEQRHLAPSISVADVFARVEDAGYRGWFLREQRRMPIAEFSVERDQLPFVGAIERGENERAYVNNFVFEPASRRVSMTA